MDFHCGPIVIASPAYFGAKLSFGELMVVVGAFNQVNTTLRCSRNGAPRCSESLSSVKYCRCLKTAVNRKTRLFNSGTSPIYGSSRMAPG